MAVQLISELVPVQKFVGIFTNKVLVFIHFFFESYLNGYLNELKTRINVLSIKIDFYQSLYSMIKFLRVSARYRLGI